MRPIGLPNMYGGRRALVLRNLARALGSARARGFVRAVAFQFARRRRSASENLSGKHAAAGTGGPGVGPAANGRDRGDLITERGPRTCASDALPVCRIRGVNLPLARVDGAAEEGLDGPKLWARHHTHAAATLGYRVLST